MCEASDDPVGVELAGCAKNAAALAAGATESQGLNAAGMAASDIFTEVLALAERNGASARTFVGRAGTGDLVATALAPQSRNRSAGELLAQGVPSEEIPDKVGQAIEAFETVPLLARAIERAGLKAPIISALARLIDGSMPLEEWVELVRITRPQALEKTGRFRLLVAARDCALAPSVRSPPCAAPLLGIALLLAAAPAASADTYTSVRGDERPGPVALRPLLRAEGRPVVGEAGPGAGARHLRRARATSASWPATSSSASPASRSGPGTAAPRASRTRRCSSAATPTRRSPTT